jgi:O-acetyl-ADP-ribose deacetylase (regulator of RNase III)
MAMASIHYHQGDIFDSKAQVIANPPLPNLLISSTINLLYSVGRNPLSTGA